MNGETDSEQALKSSDQLPEDAPAEQVPDDAPESGEGAARESARRHARRVAGSDRAEPQRGESGGSA
jgi:hypothetical protein